MRAKSEISTVSLKTFQTKVQTFYDKEERKSQMPCMEVLLPEGNVNTEEHRIKVLVTQSG